MTEGQYHVVRFSPDPVRDEPLNIGLVMTGDFETLVDFPDDALERAGRWCRTLDPAGLADLRTALVQALTRAAARSEDIGGALRPDFLGERFGPITLSEARWIDTSGTTDVAQLFTFLTNRIVRPPRPVVHGGGAAPAAKLAGAILPAVRQVFPRAQRDHPLVAHSGREFVADIYAPGPRPLVLSTLVPSSSWQGVRSVEAKAFELSDVGRAIRSADIAVCCVFPVLDPGGVRAEAEAIFRSIDVKVVTPDTVAELAHAI